MDNKLFHHIDCPSCIFIPHMGADHDLYICPQQGSPTLIFRHGNRPEDYESYPVDVILSILHTQSWKTSHQNLIKED